MARKRALVAGALGVVGSNLVQHLLASGAWEVVGIARRAAPVRPGLQHVALDLSDAAACRVALADLGGVTHVFYAVRADRADPAVEASDNLRMLVNLVEALEPASEALRHVALVHGTKWYGSHLGPFRTPAREDDPRHLPPNFYYDQQDWLAARQRGKGWTWSALRPHVVWGFSAGYRHNLATLIAVYGTLSRELGLPLCFPGTRACFEALGQLTDVGLLSRALTWAATTPACAGHAFNIVNGDYFRWCNLWPRLAEFFGVPAGPVRTIPLAAFLADKGPLWDAVVARHGLRPYRLDDLADGAYGDGLLSVGWDVMSSTVKSRRFGFQDTAETEESVLGLLAALRRDRVIP